RFNIKKAIYELKNIVFTLVRGVVTIDMQDLSAEAQNFLKESDTVTPVIQTSQPSITLTKPTQIEVKSHEPVEESLSIADREKELITKALIKYRGKRKGAARELGISERTLYRKIQEYGIKK